MISSSRSNSRRGHALLFAILLIVAVVGAAVALFVLRKDAERPAVTPVDRSSHAPSEAPTTPADDMSASIKSGGREPKRSEKGINFSVVCLGPGGAEEPLKDLEVVAIPATTGGIALEHQVSARTDAKGTVQFTNLPYTVYEVRAAPAGFVPLNVRGGRDGKRVEFLFQRGAVASGSILNAETGEPIADAYVQIRCDFGNSLTTQRIQMALRQGVDPRDIEGYDLLENPRPSFRAEATSGPDGKYTIASAPYDLNLLLSVEHDSYCAFEEVFPANAGEPITRDVRLFPRVDIFGKVVADDSGDPIPGVKVQAAEGGIPLSVMIMLGRGSGVIVDSVTDANGSYRLKNMPRGKQFVSVTYPGYEEFNGAFEIKTNDPEFLYEIHLKRSASLSGRVVDNANQPIEGVSIYYATSETQVMGSKGLPAEPHARTGPDGSFQLRAVPVARTFNVLARHPDYVNTQQDHFVLQAGEEMTGVELMMSHGGSITGEVVDALRQPLAGASIVATPVKPVGAPLRAVVSAADGSWVINNTQPAIFELACEAPGYCKSTLNNVRDVATGVQFVLVKEAIYSGRFLTGDGQPIPRFKVRLRMSNAPKDSEARVEAVRDRDGKFELKGLAPGLWDFEFTAEKLTPLLVSRVALREAERIDGQELKVLEGGRVGGIVKSLAGKPVQAALIRMDFLESFSSTDKTFTTLQASSNSNGEFEIKNLLPGRYLIWASHPSFAPVPEREIVVDMGPRQEIEFSLPKPASLRVVVRDEEGNTVPGASVWLFQGDSPTDSAKKLVGPNGMVGLQVPKNDGERSGIASASEQMQGTGPKVQVGETGEVSFSRKEPGKWTLWVTGGGYYKYSARLNLEAGKESVHEAALKKLQAGVSQQDAYDDNKAALAQRNERKNPGVDDAEGAGVRELTPEQRLVLDMQRDGEELNAEQMETLKEARRILKRAQSGHDKKEGGDDGKSTSKEDRASRRKASADTDGDGKVSPEEREAQKQRAEKRKEKKADGEGSEGAKEGGGR